MVPEVASSSSPDSRAWVREFESLGAYATAKEAFSEWFSFYHKARPVRHGEGMEDDNESVTGGEATKLDFLSDG